MSKTWLLSFLALVSLGGISNAQSAIDGSWDATVKFSDGAAAGAMHLKLEGSTISGTSEPLDEDQFLPLSVSGSLKEKRASLTFRFRDELVGSISASHTHAEMTGSGTLYGVPVMFNAVRSDRKLRAPRIHEFDPTVYELQFESRSEPVLKLVPGDTVKTTLLDNEGQDESLRWQAMPGNPLTGPFFVEGAMPGDTLVVHLKSVRLNRDTAKMHSRSINQAAIQPGHIQTPTEGWGRTWQLDREKKTGTIDAPGSALENLALPLQPMIGSIGVAPPLNTALYAGDLWVHGGNIDYRRMTEGTTLYLPVFRAGAYLSMGDGHALQGDGEISGQGLETSLNVEFEIGLIEGENLGYIWSEDADFVMVHGIDRTLDSALQAATTGMSSWLKANYQLTDSEIAALLSPTIRYDVAVVVNSRPHVVARLSKQVLSSVNRNPADN
ncbi:MAG: acetamidase/formamidase family protein [Pseudomonadota bacterium]